MPPQNNKKILDQFAKMDRVSIILRASFLLIVLLTAIVLLIGFPALAYREGTSAAAFSSANEEVFTTEEWKQAGATHRSFVITVDSSPRDVPIMIDGFAFVTPASFTWIEGSVHTLSVEAVISTGPDVRLVFVQWNDGSQETSRTIKATAGMAITAEWKTQFFLIVNENGGKASGEGWYDEGSTAVAEAALPNRDDGTLVEDAVHERFRLVSVGWAGDYTSDSRRVMVKMDGPKTLEANWKTQYFLSINAGLGREWKVGEGEFWKGVDQELQQWLDSGQSINVNAISPSRIIPQESRHVFTHWEGSVTGSSPNLTITMDSWKQLTANWKKEFYLKVNSEFGEPQGEGWYRAGTTATLSVTSPIGFGVQRVFQGWTGDYAGSELAASITMDTPKNVTAVWRTDVTQLLTIIGVIIVVPTIAVGTRFWKKTGEKDRTGRCFDYC